MQEDKNIPAEGSGAEVKQFEQAEKRADQGWEKEKDVISGVDKTIEKKQEAGTFKPEDTENLGD